MCHKVWWGLKTSCSVLLHQQDLHTVQYRTTDQFKSRSVGKRQIFWEEPVEFKVCVHFLAKTLSPYIRKPKKQTAWLLLTSNPNKTVAKNPPIKPSQVFFGDSCQRERKKGIITTCAPMLTATQTGAHTKFHLEACFRLLKSHKTGDQGTQD